MAAPTSQACHLVLLAAVLAAPGMVSDEGELLAVVNRTPTKQAGVGPAASLVQRVAIVGSDISEADVATAVAVAVDAAVRGTPAPLLFSVATLCHSPMPLPVRALAGSMRVSSCVAAVAPPERYG